MHKDMNSKMISGAVVVLILVGGGSFYSGMKYGMNKAVIGKSTFVGGPGRMQGAVGARGGMRGGGAASGEVLSKDDKSVTVKMRDGGSKIILLTPSTQVLKSAEGTITDVVVGAQVIAVGTTNSDGSVTAQSLQIRPNMPVPLTPPAVDVKK